jgi:CRISPR/Cas system-associated protein Cas10 (large subunit of type III CRISPR-Cas system)
MAKRRRIFADGLNSNVEENEDLEDDENFPCGFCGVKWAQSASTCVWIKCQICEKWWHALCVGEKGRKQFICG